MSVMWWNLQNENNADDDMWIVTVPVRVSHVAIGKSSKELAKPNLWILAILAKSINISFVAKN